MTAAAVFSGSAWDDSSSSTPKRGLWSRVQAVRGNLAQAVKKDWKWMLFNASAGVCVNAVAAAVVAPNAAFLVAGAAGVLTANTLRYAKERVAERAAASQERGSSLSRTWTQAVREELGLYGSHFFSGKFWSRNLVGGALSGASFGVLSLGAEVANFIKDAFPAAGAPSFEVSVQKAEFSAPVEARLEVPTGGAEGADPAAASLAQPALAPADALQQFRGSVSGRRLSPHVAALLHRAGNGNAQAIKDLAVYLYNGKYGLPVDADAARGLFEMAAKAGNRQAVRDLAWLNGGGFSVSDSTVKAVNAAGKAVNAAGKGLQDVLASQFSSVGAEGVIKAATPPLEISPTPHSGISAETRQAALASVGGEPGDLSNGGGRLAAECRPTVISNTGHKVLMAAKCTEFFPEMAPGDSVRHVAPDGKTELFVYGGDSTVLTSRFRLDTLKKFVGGILFPSPA